MPGLELVQTWLQERLPALLAEHQVPGAALAVAAGDEVIDVAAGVLSTATGVEATTDSVFQIGSITKVWTSALAMQLVDEGRLDLDAPVRSYVPEFRLADETAAAAITVRQLMCHTSGFEGDIFTDTGKGDDAVERYIDALTEVGQLVPPGERFSYNNAGFCVLGRVVEVLRGKPFDDCLREHLFAPLGLTHAAPSPYEAILHRAAVGHIQPTPEADPQPAPVWALARSNGPAGSMLAMSARDLVTFARMHIGAGAGPDGTRVLSDVSVRAMQQRQVELPPLGLMGDAWGLGWEIYDWPGGTVIGHDGNTIGQSALLRVVPSQNVAIALLTNGGSPISVYMELFPRLLAELAGVTMPPLPMPPDQRQPIDAQRYVGTYSSEVLELTVSQDVDGRVWLEMAPKGILAELGEQPERIELVRLDGDTLVPTQARHGLHAPHAFVGDDGSGRALYIHNGRATRRVPTQLPTLEAR
ncbi:MAG TPA: serine hydrolase domain-containing protein [Jiangellales bacterium]|nr:serine hydrolase domain-containing protein [Jiangellales bacterium]